MRLEAQGYAPRYVFDMNLKPGENSDLGHTQLQRALSVFGRAVRKDGSAPPGPCRATLMPDAERGGGPGAPEPDNPPPDEQSFTVPLSQQGYFQVVGVMQGNHSILVACPGASGFALLKVQPSGETRIDPPLMLEELTLDIALSPKTDTVGKPWRVTVNVTAPRLRRIADSSEATADGHWTRHGLMTGSYRVAVSSSDDMQWLKQDFELRPDSTPMALHLVAVRVAGKVLLSGQPVKARLEFSNEDGGDPVTLNSDVSGRYAGLLPIAPDAKDTSWIVEAHVSHPETVRKLSNLLVPRVAEGKTVPLDLELPNIPVRGIVVSEDGKPQKGAQVTFKADGGYQTATSSDDMGSFEMADLSPGNYSAMAQSDYGVSDPTPFVVNDSTENKLKLVMHPNLHIPFYVIAKDQEPISDATVQVWVAPGVPLAFGHTNRDGRYEATLPPGTTEVGLTVGASDYAVNIVKMPVS
ncbi:MAG: MSCRAMM family protein, partial [Terracidiphilus sp.]